MRWDAVPRFVMASIRANKSKRNNKTISYTVYFRDNNNKSKEKTFKKRHDARVFCAEIERNKLHGELFDLEAGKQTFQTFATNWFLNQMHYSPTTQECMAGRLKKHIYPVIGSMSLNQIRPSHISALLAGWNLAEGTKRVCLSYVCTILQAAMDDNLISSNPAKAASVKRPKRSMPRVRAWDGEKVARVRQNLPAHLQIICIIGSGLGLRQGEMLGLAVEDIDWERSVVHVRRQRIELNNGRTVIFKLPKGEKERDVPLPASVMHQLTEHLNHYPPVSVTHPWGAPAGNPVTATLVLSHYYKNDAAAPSSELNKRTANNAWRKAVKLAGLQVGNRINGMHALRHYYASVLLDAGANIKALSEHLGHKNVMETLNTYAHMMPAANSLTTTTIDANFALLF